MNHQTEICSFAKINLGLVVTAKRPDGYHTLDSLMQTIDWHDELSIKTIPGRGRLELTGNVPQIPWGPGNILWKTYHALQDRFSCLDSLQVKVKKEIPWGGGLGGGSSNAAAFLLYLIRRFQLPLPESDRLNLASELGADVPFFLWGGTARIAGIGEQVSLLDDLNLAPLVAVTPPIAVSTALVFSHFSLTIPAPDSRIKTFLSTADPACLVNQLMPVTARLYPEITAVADDLRQAGCLVVLMSGSGSTMLGFGGQPDLERLKRKYRQVRWCCGVKRSEYLTGVGASPSGKASAFGADTRRFESSRPSLWRKHE